MSVYFLNCGSMHPYFPPVENGVTCLLIETNHGPVLADTGLGIQDYHNPDRRMNFFLKMMRSKRDINETALYQIQRLGYKREDVKHIIQTHLHLDHAGGLRDFPEAQVHVYKPEHTHIMSHRSWKYITDHWKHKPSWVLHELTGESWFGFDAIQLKGFEPEVWLVPLTGHTPGHMAVAVKQNQTWAMHGGDAVPFNAMLEKGPPDWISRSMLGPHIPRIRRLIKLNPQIKLVGAHMSPGFYDTV